MTVPRSLLGAIRADQLEWLVPAWLRDKVVAYLRALPKEQRRPLVPLPDTARRGARRDGRDGGPAVVGDRARGSACARCAGSRSTRARSTSACCRRTCACASPSSMRTGACSAQAASSRALQRELGARGGRRCRCEAAPARWHRTGLTRWDFGDLPPSPSSSRSGRTPLTLYPGARRRRRAAWTSGSQPPGAGCRRAASRRRAAAAAQSVAAAGGVDPRPHARRPRARAARITASATVRRSSTTCCWPAAEQAFELDPPVRTEAEFAARLERGRAQLVAEADALRALLARDPAVAARIAARARRGRARATRMRTSATTLAAQLAELVGPRMLTQHAARVAAASAALLARGRAALAEARSAQRAEARGRGAHGRGAARRIGARRSRRARRGPPAIVEYRWLLEEFRVSLFAQQLGTARSVSAKRLEQAWRKALASG